MPTTHDRDKSEELARKANADRSNQLRCIGSTIAIAILISSIVTIIYLIVR